MVTNIENIMKNGLPVAGYVPQTDEKIVLVNENEIIEERALRQVERIAASGIADLDMTARAFDEIRSAFMWLNRAVFQPTRIALPGE